MQRPSLAASTTISAIALALWASVAWLALDIDAKQTAVASAIAQSKRELSEHRAESAALALAGATAAGRTELESALDRDILSIAGLLEKAGSDAGVAVSVTGVTPGPAPRLEHGAVLHPSEVTFAAKATGPYPKLLEALGLLEAIPAVSQVEDIRMARGDTGAWTMDIDINVITGSPISS